MKLFFTLLLLAACLAIALPIEFATGLKTDAMCSINGGIGMLIGLFSECLFKLL